MFNINDLKMPDIDFDKPTVIFENDNHTVYWLGIMSDTVFRCNTYLIADDNYFMLIDPGSKSFFKHVKNRVAQITDPKNITSIFINHQDPDVAASLSDWLQLKPSIVVFGSPRVFVLLPHYDIPNCETVDVETHQEFKLPSGRSVSFYPSPFLHSPMACTIFDNTSGFLFSGDIFASLDTNWKLIVNDFLAHTRKMDLFHLDYMSSNIATRGYAETIKDLKIDAILPQHGSIILKKDVKNALEYLRNLRCGLDNYYIQL